MVEQSVLQATGTVWLATVEIKFVKQVDFDDWRHRVGVRERDTEQKRLLQVRARSLQQLIVTLRRLCVGRSQLPSRRWGGEKGWEE